METTNCLMFEMKVLNDLRKMSPEQRKEILSSIEREEQQEQEALKKNPNLHLERQMSQVLTELKDLRKEFDAFQLQQAVQQVIYDRAERGEKGELRKLDNPYKIDTVDKLERLENTQLHNEDTLEDYELCSIFSFDWLPMWIFFILLFISLLAPSKPHTPLRAFAI